MVSRKAVRGVMNENTTHIAAAPQMLTVDAFLVIATVAMDSPYVVFGHPPKTDPTNDPIPSPRRVLSSPGSERRSFPTIEDRFLWSARCSANTTKATGTYAVNSVTRYDQVMSPKEPAPSANVKFGREMTDFIFWSAL